MSKICKKQTCQKNVFFYPKKFCKVCFVKKKSIFLISHLIIIKLSKFQHIINLYGSQLIRFQKIRTMASGPNTTVPQTFIKQEPGLNGLKIKDEPGLHQIRSDRLSSFKLPRDLTLGGLIPTKNAKNLNNKKVYTPNLNAVRNKNT